jgi:hypothetical protein
MSALSNNPKKSELVGFEINVEFLVFYQKPFFHRSDFLLQKFSSLAGKEVLIENSTEVDMATVFSF